MASLGFGVLDYLSALVVSATGADSVRRSRLIAVRAKGSCRKGDGIISPALVSPGARVSSLW